MVWQMELNKEKIGILEDVFKALEQKNDTLALELAIKRLEVCRKDNIHDKHGILLLIAERIFSLKGQFDKSRECLNTCRKLFEKHPTDNASYHAGYYQSEGLRYWNEENIEDALIAFLKSEKAQKDIEQPSFWDTYNKMLLYQLLSVIYFEYNFYEESTSYCDMALSIAEKNNNKGMIARMLDAKGALANKAGDYEEAEQYYHCALAYKRNANNTYGIGITLFNLGEIAFSQKQYHRCIEYLSEILTLEFDPGNSEKYWLTIKAGTFNLIGDAYFELCKYNKAEELQIEALRIIGQTKSNRIKKKIYQSCCDLYKKQGDFEKAFQYSKKIRDLQNKELQHTTSKRIASLRIEYEQQGKDEIVKHFSRKVEELEATNSYLGQIASSISHDLRAPLRNTISYLSLLDYKYGNRFSDEGKEFLEIATDAAKDTEILTKSLADLGKVKTDPDTFDDVDVKDIIDRVRRNLSCEIQQKNVEFNIDELPIIIANEGQMLQLFQNLISNAIKYNESQSPCIDISCTKNESGQHEFAVTDNGIGIAPKYHEQIFQIFKRLHSAYEYKGTGIGLAICSLIVKKHGGNIWVESKPQKGSTFKFTLM